MSGRIQIQTKCNRFTLKSAVLLVLSITTLSSFSQNAKKETIAIYKQLTNLSFAQIESQKYSDLAKEVTIEDFIAYYIENGKEKYSKKYGHEYIDSLYSDSAYTYYLNRSQVYAMAFLKVRLADINNINISAIDGNFIRKKFIDEVVPKKDKERVDKKGKDCVMGSDYWDFEYHYEKKSRLVEVKYKWKVTCDFIRVINKNYKSYYNIDDKSLQN